jgi:hypothetical protein
MDTPFEPIMVDDDNDSKFGALTSNEDTSRILCFFTNKFSLKYPILIDVKNATLSFWTS